MGKSIAIVNQKGGVGKTTSCVNLAAALTAQGAKVLVCDFDPQGNATSGFGVDKNRSPSVYDVVLGGAPASRAIVSTKWADVMPANKALSGATVELIGLDRREFRLRDALEEIKGGYDFIFIDCPPLPGAADAGRPVRRRHPAGPRPVRVLRAGGPIRPAVHRPAGQAAAEPRAGDGGRTAHHVRWTHQPVPAGGGGGQAPLPRQGVRFGDPPERPTVRGPQPWRACNGVRPLLHGDGSLPFTGEGIFVEEPCFT